MEQEHLDAFLDRSCAGDAELRRELTSLLKADAAPGPLEDLAREVVSPLVSHVSGEPQPGARIGAYRIVRRLGSGGMGVVYLAERADGQFEQRVALKLVRDGGEPVVERLLNERRILARLVHPNVARLYDGGFYDPRGDGKGRPYFVMEFVEGRPLDRYAEEEALDVPARLRLFCNVCDAVEHAHRNLVVHGDLKPSNILVDRDGGVKLLDFGLARLLEDSPDGAERRPARLLTPDYASPEQIRGEPVTTASDVYSLGSVLYELLAGRRPYCFSSSSSAEEMLRLRSEGRISPPSKAASEEEMPSSRNPAARHLEGDLDAIVLKALAPDPADRYASVERLADDIRRHLRFEPVSARPATIAYRTSRLVRRNRVGALAGLLVALALVVGLAGTLWQARIARQERDRAQIGEAKAQEVAAFLIDLFKVADPSESLGNTITARELLERGAERVDDELPDQPLLQATMMDVVGQVYLSLGLRERAAPLIERALSMRKELFPEGHPDVATSLDHFARVEYERGEFDAAEMLLQESLRLRRIYGTESERAATLHDLGIVLSDAGHLEEAELALAEALEIRRRMPGPGRHDLVETLNGMALALHRQSRFAEAEAYFREAVRVGEGIAGRRTPEQVSSLRNLARLEHRFDHNYAEAEARYRTVLTASRVLYGPSHPEVAVSLSDLAQVLRDEGRYDEAESVAREGLAMWTALNGEENTETAISMDILAGILWQRGDPEAAADIYRRTMTMRKKLLGEDHPRVISGYTTMGGLLLEMERLPEAEQHYREALRRAEAAYGSDHAYTAIALDGLGNVYRLSGRASEAAGFYRQALAIRQRLHEPGHWRIADAKSALASALIDLREFEEAERLLQEAYTVLQRERGDADEATRRASELLDDLYAR